jgi:hypothetical protein
MASRGLVQHILTSGGTKIGISEPDKYEGIKDIVGIRKAESGDTVDDSATISELKKRGKAMTLAAIDVDKKQHKILCAIDKVAAAISTLKGKSFGGKVIKSVSVPRRRSRR